jgi:hypothetical protein
LPNAAKLLVRAREDFVGLAKRHGLCQFYARVGKIALIATNATRTPSNSNVSAGHQKLYERSSAG